MTNNKSIFGETCNIHALLRQRWGEDFWREINICLKINNLASSSDIQHETNNFVFNISLCFI